MVFAQKMTTTGRRQAQVSSRFAAVGRSAGRVRRKAWLALAVVAVAGASLGGYTIGRRTADGTKARRTPSSTPLDLQVAPPDGSCPQGSFIFTGEPDAAGHRSFCLPETAPGARVGAGK